MLASLHRQPTRALDDYDRYVGPGRRSEQTGDIIPVDFLTDLKGQLAGLEGIEEFGMQVVGDAAGAVEEIGKEAEKAADEAKKAVEDAAKGIKDLFPGGKRD